MPLPSDFDRDALGRYADVTHDSTAVTANALFACVVGERFDGHDFAVDAVANGATGLLVQRPLGIAAEDVDEYVVPDVRVAMGEAAAIVHGRPAEQLKMFGVTGTNGKTTVTHLLGDLLGAAGLDARQLGTLSGARTTPEAPELQRTLRAFVDDGVDAVAMEVSSHAMVQHRVDGAHFDVAVFTNLGQDHLDLHGTIDAYFRAKASLFVPGMADIGVVNVDDMYGRLLADAADIEIHTFSGADAVGPRVGVGELAFTWRGHRTRLPFGGGFNVLNAVAALTAAVAAGVDPATAAGALATARPVPGRFEPITTDEHPFSVIVDYAHTPDGVATLIDAARNLSEHGRILIVLGAGGDRDREKRPLMGAAASHADVVIVTSDNPRHEPPEAIIDAILAGVDRSVDPVVEPDRRAAIATAIETARPGDIVLIAGKGHEPTQTIGDDVLDFDDRIVARELLELHQ